MMTRSVLLCLGLCAWLLGCSTTQVAPQSARPVPSDRVLAAAAPGDAEIEVVRDAGLLGGGCYLALLVNRQLVARMDTGEAVKQRVPSGDLLLAVAPDPHGKALCGIKADMRVQREFAIKPGEIKRFRLAVGPGGMDVLRSDF